MDSTTQAGLVLALLALLVLLLGLNSRRRRRERDETTEARHETTEPVTSDLVVTDAVTAEADLAVGDETVAAEDEDGDEDASDEEPAAQLEPEQDDAADPDAPAGTTADTVDEQEPADEPAEPEAEAEAEAEAEVEPEQVEEPAATAYAVEPAPAKRRWGLLRRRTRAVPETATTQLPVAPPAETDGSPEQLELRMLREQLKALEQVVQEQVSEPPTAALARVEEAAAVQSAAYLRQVSLVVQGLAAHTSPEEDSQRTLSRVAAAVERLGVPNAMQRPVLPLTTQPPTPRVPSHLREVPELEAAAAQPSEPQHEAVADVFSNLDVAGREFQPVAEAAPEELPAPEAADPVPAGPVGLTSVPAAAPAGMPVDEPSYPAFEDAATALSSALEDFQSAEPELVMPVPPPAVIPLESRRRGRRNKSI